MNQIPASDTGGFKYCWGTTCLELRVLTQSEINDSYMGSEKCVGFQPAA